MGLSGASKKGVSIFPSSQDQDHSAHPAVPHRQQRFDGAVDLQQRQVLLQPQRDPVDAQGAPIHVQKVLVDAKREPVVRPATQANAQAPEQFHLPRSQRQVRLIINLKADLPLHDDRVQPQAHET